MSKKLGSAPIEDEYRITMEMLAKGIGDFLQEEHGREIGFCLMMFELGDRDSRCNYISNAEREDIKVLLREQLAYFEGMPETSGTA